MITPVLISEFFPLRAEVLLHEGVHDDLLPYSVPRDLPDELARPTLLRVNVARRSSELRIIVIHLHT